jgi:hypothetical protein
MFAYWGVKISKKEYLQQAQTYLFLNSVALDAANQKIYFLHDDDNNRYLFLQFPLALHLRDVHDHVHE